MVISKNALEKYGDNISKNPVGTGPFFLNHWEDDKLISLRTFPDYREKGNIDVIKFIMPDSSQQAEVLFKNGKLDIVYMVASDWLDRLKWTGMVDYLVQKPLGTIFVGFNLNNDPVNKKSIRDAVRYALETEKSVFITNRGNAISANGPLPPVYNGFDDMVQTKFNPILANKLLRDMGYNKGLSLNFYVWEKTISRHTRIEIIESQLEKVGITLKSTLYKNWDDFTSAVSSKECHLFLGGYSSELIGDPGNFLYSLFHSNSTYNLFNYKNENVNQLLDQAFREANQKRRHEMYREVVKIVLEYTPAVFDSHVKSHYAYNSKKIKSLVVNPYEYIYFHRLETYDYSF